MHVPEKIFCVWAVIGLTVAWKGLKVFAGLNRKSQNCSSCEKVLAFKWLFFSNWWVVCRLLWKDFCVVILCLKTCDWWICVFLGLFNLHRVFTAMRNCVLFFDMQVFYLFIQITTEKSCCFIILPEIVIYDVGRIWRPGNFFWIPDSLYSRKRAAEKNCITCEVHRAIKIQLLKVILLFLQIGGEKGLVINKASSVKQNLRGKECAAFGCSATSYDKEGTATGRHFKVSPLPSEINRWCNVIKKQNNKDRFNDSLNINLCP